jgi:hypothetical protein
MKLKIAIYIIVINCCIVTLAAQQKDYSYPFYFYNKYGLVDNKNKVILEPTYYHIDPFDSQYSNDYSVFSLIDTVQRLYKKGILNKKGKVMIPAKYDKLDYDGNGYYCFHIARYDTIEIIDIKRKKTVLKTAFTNYTSKNGLLSIELPDGLSRIIVFNTGKTKTIKDYVELIDMDTLKVYKIDTKPVPTYLDISGKVIKSKNADDFYGFDDYGMIEESYNSDIARENQAAFLALQIKLGAGNLTHIQNPSMDYPVKAIYRNPTDNTIKLMDLSGNIVFEKEGVIEIKLLEYKFKTTPNLLYKKDGYWGLINLDGKIVLTHEFTKIEKVDSIYFSVNHKSGYGGLASWDGRLMLPEACNCLK